MSRLSDVAAEWQLTLAQARALADDPPPGFSDKNKRRLAAFLANYEAAERRKQIERYKSSTSGMTGRLNQLRDRAAKNRSRIKSIRKAVRTGRMSPAEAREEIAELVRRHKADVETAKSIKQGAADAWQMVSTDAADAQAKSLARFGSLRDALPRLSRSHLDGDNSAADPFTR